MLKSIQLLNASHMLVALLLGGMMLWGGFQKFAKPLPEPSAQIEQFRAGKLGTDDLETLRIKNYIFGMKQTGYFWPFLGVCEIFAGLLLLGQVTRLAGAVIALPMVIHIFLFHFFLEPNDIVELVKTGLLLTANLLLIGIDFPKWQHLLFDKSNITF